MKPQEEEVLVSSVKKLQDEIDQLIIARDDSEGDSSRAEHFQNLIFQKFALIDLLMESASAPMREFGKVLVAMKSKQVRAEVEELKQVVPKQATAEMEEEPGADKKNEGQEAFFGLDWRSKIATKFRIGLIYAARFCLIAAFLEDGLRMYSQWNEQRDYMDASWKCGFFWATLFVLINSLGQLGASVMVLGRFEVGIACRFLIFTVLLQTFTCRIYWPLSLLPYLTWTLSRIGALLLGLRESQREASILAGHSGNNKRPTFLQESTSRLLLGCMFFTLWQEERTVMQFLQKASAWFLTLHMALALKPKFSALMLVVWLNVHNFYVNSWWTAPVDSHIREVLQTTFFQTLSIIGGLLMVALYEPVAKHIDG